MPGGHRSAFEPYLARCAAGAPEWRWVAAENLHVTVRFLGHVEEELAGAIGAALEGERLAGFELRLGGVGAFKRGRTARVIWLGLARGEVDAAGLAARVEARCREAGLAPETRAFHAHITLARARAREGSAPPALEEPPALREWRADQLVLYRSRLGRGGSVYEPMRRISLS